MPRTRSFNDQLRSVINRSGLTSYEIKKRCGVDIGALNKFRRGEAGLMGPNLERLTQLFGLKITASRPHGGPKRGKKKKG